MERKRKKQKEKKKMRKIRKRGGGELRQNVYYALEKVLGVFIMFCNMCDTS